MNDSTAAILLVEDSRSDAVLPQESLMEGQGQGAPGFHFTLAESWAEAVALLQKRSFDVLLLDLSLPDSSGRDTFVRARAVAPHLPIVVLTGEADEAVGLEAVRHGVQDYLIKGQAYGRQTARAIRYAIERKQAESASGIARPSCRKLTGRCRLRWPNASGPRPPTGRSCAAWRLPKRRSAGACPASCTTDWDRTSPR